MLNLYAPLTLRFGRPNSPKPTIPTRKKKIKHFTIPCLPHQSYTSHNQFVRVSPPLQGYKLSYDKPRRLVGNSPDARDGCRLRGGGD
jgi:hypothetical protein